MTSSIYNPRWQQRRSRLNHDWLKNQYLQALGRWLNILDGHVRHRETERTFIVSVLPQWESHCPEVRELIDDFPKSMTPARLFEIEPLCRCDVDTIRWLPPIVDQIWRARYKVDECVAEARLALDEASAAYRSLSRGIRACGDHAPVAELRKKRDVFARFLDASEVLGSALSRFPSEVAVI